MLLKRDGKGEVRNPVIPRRLSSKTIDAENKAVLFVWAQLHNIQQYVLFIEGFLRMKKYNLPNIYMFVKPQNKLLTNCKKKVN